MPSEKWTPRFGERVITPKPNEVGIVVAIDHENNGAKVCFDDGFCHCNYHFSELEPAPDPAVANLFKAAKFMRQKLWEFHSKSLCDDIDGYAEHSGNIEEFAAKGGAE